MVLGADSGRRVPPDDAGSSSPAVVVVGDEARVSVRGDLDVGTSSALVDAVVAALGDRQLGRVVVDMSDAGFVDSTGLGSLVTLRAEARRRGARTALVGLDPRLEKLLVLTGLDQEFDSPAGPATSVDARAAGSPQTTRGPGLPGPFVPSQHSVSEGGLEPPRPIKGTSTSS